MMFIANYTRNSNQKSDQNISVMFYTKCRFRKIVNIFPDEEPCKYGDVNRFVRYCCILLLFIVLLMIKPLKPSENDTFLYLLKASENQFVSRGSRNLTLGTYFLS